MADYTNPFPAEAFSRNRSGRLTARSGAPLPEHGGRAPPEYARSGRSGRGDWRTCCSPHRPGSRSRHAASRGVGIPRRGGRDPGWPASIRWRPTSATVGWKASRAASARDACNRRRPSGRPRYYLVISGRRLLTYRSAYDAAPDAGYVRAYFLPRTRRLVNLERRRIRRSRRILASSATCSGASAMPSPATIPQPSRKRPRTLRA